MPCPGWSNKVIKAPPTFYCRHLLPLSERREGWVEEKIFLAFSHKIFLCQKTLYGEKSFRFGQKKLCQKKSWIQSKKKKSYIGIIFIPIPLRAPQSIMIMRMMAIIGCLMVYWGLVKTMLFPSHPI